jgi:hypothetical protein
MASQKHASDHESHVTTDHKTIRRWVEARCGQPSTVKGTAHKGEDAGLLRIDFPPSPSNDLEAVPWDEFFEKFDDAGHAFLYQEHTADGQESRFCKFVSRETAAAHH